MDRAHEAPGLHSRIERLTRWINPRALTEFLVVGICSLAFALNAVGICVTLLTANYAGARDFVTYWSSGHQLTQHANPYDGIAILRLERSVGYPGDLPALIMRNPPTALPLVLPLGFLGVRSASLLWSFLMVASLVLSVRMIAAIHDRSKSPLNILGYTFAPALSCLISGQMALFVLLGLVLFLRLHPTRPFLAGASLWLCALKPQLFLPFGLVLLIWSILSRRYTILLGAAIALAFSAAAPLVIDPLVWVHYAQMMKAARIDAQIVPCIGLMLRMTVSPNTLWLQYLPAALGSLWAIDYFRRHREQWDWVEHGSLLMMVSVAVAPYSWFMDQAVLIPALLHALYRNRSRSLVGILALLSAVIEIANFRGVPLGNSRLYPWTATVLLAWYLVTVGRAQYAPPQVVEATPGLPKEA